MTITAAQVVNTYRDAGVRLDRPTEAKLAGLGDTPVTPGLLARLQIDDEKAAEIMGSQWWSIRGIGPALGSQLWQEGMRSLPGRESKWFSRLPLQAQVWITHDPLGRIPNAAVPPIAAEFMQGERDWETVGSWRRGRPLVGDVDILYWGPDLDRLLDRLHAAHGDRWEVYARGPHKIGGMFRPAGHGGKWVEVDLWIANRDTLPYMRLYATGSKQWNVVMRQIAKRKGMKLNQYGLYRADGSLIPARSEQEIFRHLGIKYKEPNQR